jgi:ACS family glucarate transporter-like MFS transporter
MNNNNPSLVRWRILGILALASFFSYVLRSNLSLAPQAMMADLGLTEIQWGWIMAAFPLGYALFQFPGGVFADRVGPRRAIALIAVLWGLLTMATTLVPGPGSASVTVTIAFLIIVRFLVGAVHAPIFPAANTAIQHWFPVGQWAFPTGLSSTGLTLGFAATAPVLTWLVLEYGWRVAFNLLAPFAFLVAAVWWWYARDKPEQHQAANPAEIELISRGKLHPEEHHEGPPAWLRLLQDRDVLLLTLSYACMSFVFYGVFSWFFYYLTAVREFDAQTAGWVTSTQWIAGGVGAALGGWLCDRLCRKLGLRWGCRWPVLVGMSLSGLLLIGGTLSGHPQLAVVMFVFCFFFNQVTEGGYWAVSIAIGGDHAGAAGGIMNTGGNASGVLNALLVPVVAKSLGWTAAMAMGGVLALVGAGLMFLVRADHQFDVD